MAREVVKVWAPASVANVAVGYDILGFAIHGPGDEILLKRGKDKGLKIVEALARRSPDVTFVLAGWGPIDPRDSGLSNVHCLTVSDREQMRDLYRAATLLILPSIGEGFPLVIQEAMACGLPVICSDETATADTALAGRIDHAPVDLNALPASVDAWAKVLDRVLPIARAETDGDRAARAEFAAERYGWPATIAAYQAILENVTAR